MVTVIKPKKTLSLDDIREIWEYKGLLYFFVWRDLKVKYKQTIVGIGWAIFQPFINMVVFSIFFGRLIQVPSDGIPYPIFVYTGLLFWQLFSGALTDTANCLLGNASLINKIYFPRVILPLTSTANKFVDLFFASLAMIYLMIHYGYHPQLIGLVLIPVLLIITSCTALGIGMFMASINIKYRDVRYILPFFIQMFMFLTPVIYPVSVAGKYQWLLSINPMTAVVQTARSGLLNVSVIDWSSLATSFTISILLFILGLITFKKTERYFSDLA